MARILLTAELGSGFGHVGRLLPIARELAVAGHEPIFALRDIRAGSHYLRADACPVLQAPYWQLTPWLGKRPFVAATYADLLARHGYDNEADLAAMLRAWDTMLRLVDPQLIIADHSPTVCLAASQRVPVVLVGDGFTIPPASDRGFGLLSQEPPLVTSDQLLRVVQAVQRRRGGIAPESLPVAFEAQARFLVTFRELDPYRSVRDEPLAGPLDAWCPPVEPPTTRTVFAYLDANYAGVTEILTAFVAAGVRCQAYIRNHSPELVAHLRATGVDMYDSPRDLATILPRVTTVVHHAGLNTCTASLIAGRPQLLLPRHLEQDINTRALGELGVGRTLGGRLTLRAIGDALRNLVEDHSVSSRAHEVAVSLHQRGAQGSLPSILHTCQQLL